MSHNAPTLTKDVAGKSSTAKGGSRAFLSCDICRSGDRCKANLDAPVGGATVRRCIAGDRLALAIADDREPARIDALPVQIAGDRKRAILRQLQIVVVVAGGIGVAVDVDQGAVEPLQNQCDGIQRRVERRIDRRRIGANVMFDGMFRMM